MVLPAIIAINGKFTLSILMVLLFLWPSMCTSGSEPYIHHHYGTLSGVKNIIKQHTCTTTNGPLCDSVSRENDVTSMFFPTNHV